MRTRWIGMLVLMAIAVGAAIAPWSPRWLIAVLWFYFGWQWYRTELLVLARLRARAAEEGQHAAR